MNYQIKLVLSYDYATPAGHGHHVLCLLPMDAGPDQSLLSATLEVSPQPEERLEHRDFFGNRFTEIKFRAPHDTIRVTMTAQVARGEGTVQRDGSLPLADLPARLAELRDLGAQSPLHFLAPSGRVPRDAAMTRFAQDAVQPGMNVAEAALAVGRALHRHMRFAPDATDVTTPAQDAFARRAGVCQDFSHILIACLRGIGIPAGYVSGFLRTLPPPGEARLEGADAMHAWVRVWCGGACGWIEFDPTNDMLAGADHVVVARGRDYSDVAPIKGALRLSGGQTSQLTVDMAPGPA